MLMRSALRTTLLAIASLACAGGQAGAQLILNAAKVSSTFPPNTFTSPPTCFYFTLHGLAQPFAIPQSASGYQEQVAVVMTAAATGQVLYVYTEGNVACGLTAVKVAFIQWPP